MKFNFNNRRGSFFLIIICLVFIITGIVLINGLRTDTVGEIIKNDELIKILMVLYDGDTVIWGDVLVYYPVSKRGAVFDVPGNTGSIFSSLERVDRIDEVYREKGIETYKAEIEKLTGVSIPFTIEISIQNFSVLVDLLGGLRVFIPSPVDYVEDGVHYLLPSGAVMLDGDKVCTYLEYKLPDETLSDIQERRQNTVVSFLAAINANKSKMFGKEVFPVYSKLFESNVDKNGFYRLLSEVSEIDADRLMPQTVTGSSRYVDGQTLLFPYYDGQLIKDILKQTTTALVSESGKVSSRVYVLEIQNGTNVQGLARNTAALLQSAGYDVLSMVNADSNDYEQTVIIDHIGNEAEVKSLASFIRCENIITEEIKEDDDLEADSLVDFTVILGKDFDGRYVR